MEPNPLRELMNLLEDAANALFNVCAFRTEEDWQTYKPKMREVYMKIFSIVTHDDRGEICLTPEKPR